ncbi:hypothetical protein [Serratia marcescens]|uniref:hypothetical protein n=1 Tax=Serratia marcescens TaxID=615 RepID=UPI001021EA83|nr:hypothetical protein [Serratia marcescens]RZF14197.1 hypothetical protein B7L32_15010 [Serratia marcescens]BEO77825.1 hypothetical protein SMTE4_37950 [Serratia marcescens]
MRKQHGAFAAFTIRHIDISDLHEKADQVEVLSLAVKRLLSLRAMENIDIETLLELQQNLAAEISNGLQGVMDQEVKDA